MSPKVQVMSCGNEAWLQTEPGSEGIVSDAEQTTWRTWWVCRTAAADERTDIGCGRGQMKTEDLLRHSRELFASELTGKRSWGGC